MLIIDGSQGEGGGQILRTALSLAMLTGTPFTLENIRAKRRKPGLLRQHLTCVKAAQQISGAKVRGGELGSRSLTFESGPIRSGAYEFAIGSAGSTSLVFQTILPALLAADGPSTVKLSGGTHNPSAPSFDYLERAFLPLLARMGANVEAKLLSHGFYPAGGGRWSATIAPAKLAPITIEARGDTTMRQVTADVSNIPYEIAEREMLEVLKLMSWPRECGRARTVRSDGPGNVVRVEIGHDNVTEIFTGFGERGISAEAVAANTVGEARDYLANGAPVGPHLCDQLLLPLAMAGGGTFVTMPPTEHTRTNITVIEKFLPVEITLEDLGERRWRVSVA